MLNNIHLTPFAVSGFLIAITCLILIVIVIIYGPRKIHKIYALASFSVVIWGIGSFLIGIAKDGASALFAFKIGYIGAIFIPPFFLHVFLIFLERKRPLLLSFAYAQAVISLFLIVTNKLFYHVKFMFNSLYYAQFTSLGIASFIIWVLLVTLEHYEFLRSLRFYKTLEINRRNQIVCFFIATFLGCIGGIANFLPALGLDIYPYGNFGIPFYSIVTTFAILKFGLMDINIVIKRGFIYSTLVVLITSSYLIVVLLTERMFQGLMGYQSLFISIGYAFLLSIFFVPLKNTIQRVADRIFLGKTPIQIAEENELLKQELEKSERMKTVAALASGMAHEIKNPLTALKTFSEYLPQKINDPEFLAKFSKIVGTEVGRIDNLVHQLLEFAKPSPLKLEEVDIHKLLEDTLEFLSNDLIKHRIKVVKELQATSYKLQADANRLKQAFLNLFLNAIDAMPSGGTLTVSTNLCSSDASKSVSICVKDTGIGINDKLLPHIFEPFHSTKEKGTGLGLSITYGIIKEHGGEIMVESLIGEGSRFIIQLPDHRFW